MSLFDYAEARKPQKPEIDETVPVLKREPLSVSRLTFQVKGVMERDFSDVWVVGQVSNCTKHRSGHVYLTLKDDGAQLPAVVWKSSMSRVRFDINDGMELVCRGRLDVYPPQGKYQMIVNSLEPKGIGSLELAFRQLHDKLAKAGLFDPVKKKPLPRPLRKVAVLTSPTGAAVRDFLQVLGRRTKRIDIVLVPVPVQGDGAAANIARRIEQLNKIGKSLGIDALIVTRGGGSTEDLWAFNEEILVRAVAASSIPVVSAVGHEIDVSLCDLAADVHALTPSEAAERISPEDSELKRGLVQVRRLLDGSMQKRFQVLRERLRFAEKHPCFAFPERIIETRRRAVDLVEERLEQSMERRLRTATDRLAKTAAALHALSPLAVLGRGFSLTENESGKIVRSVEEITSGDRIQTRFVDGTIESVVGDVRKNS